MRKLNPKALITASMIALGGFTTSLAVYGTQPSGATATGVSVALQKAEKPRLYLPLLRPRPVKKKPGPVIQEWDELLSPNDPLYAEHLLEKIRAHQVEGVEPGSSLKGSARGWGNKELREVKNQTGYLADIRTAFLQHPYLIAARMDDWRSTRYGVYEKADITAAAKTFASQLIGESFSPAPAAANGIDPMRVLLELDYRFSGLSYEERPGVPPQHPYMPVFPYGWSEMTIADAIGAAAAADPAGAKIFMAKFAALARRFTPEEETHFSPFLTVYGRAITDPAAKLFASELIGKVFSQPPLAAGKSDLMRMLNLDAMFTARFYRGTPFSPGASATAQFPCGWSKTVMYEALGDFAAADPAGAKNLMERFTLLAKGFTPQQKEYYAPFIERYEKALNQGMELPAPAVPPASRPAGKTPARTPDFFEQFFPKN